MRKIKGMGNKIMAPEKNKNKKVQKKNNMPLLIGAAVILCLAVVVMLIPRGEQQEEASADADRNANTVESDVSRQEQPGTVKEEDAAEEEAGVQVIEAGDSLVIPISEVSATAQFYPIEVDGTRMEVLAVRDSAGNVRTAFNTCQICYGSGRGYYVQEGDVLVCQNCRNRFTIDQVEIESGGCNPWPIFEENKTVTEDTIGISYDFLQESEAIFANWKLNY